MNTSVQPVRLDQELIAFTTECPGRAVFKHIASRWGLLLLVTLGEGPLRYHHLRNRIEGISEKMLTQTLKSLVRDGLVRRLVEPTNPPRVTYELTPIGEYLAAPLRDVVVRLGRRVPDILAAQQSYDRQPSSAIEPAASC
jgi:DNA-binding HxlR family transcriptional regulator